MDKRKKIILGILAVIIVLFITMVAVIISLNRKQKLLDLQKIATVKYFEECMDIKELYLKSESTYVDVNEPQFIEIQLKLALDNYFKEHADAENAPADEIKEIMWNPHELDIDFNGVFVTGYTYNIENNAFTKTSNENGTLSNTDALIQLVEEKIRGIDNQEIQVDKIEKNKKNIYMVYCNILGYKDDLKQVVANAIITVEITNDDSGTEQKSSYDGNLAITNVNISNID